MYKRQPSTGPYSDPLDTTSSVGSYAAMSGQTNKYLLKNSQCLSNGLFVYKFKRKVKQITDGTSKTIAFGEVQAPDTPHGYNIWTQAFHNGSTMRETVNAINTPPGPVPDLANWKPLSECKYAPACWNGAFGSDHGGGALFCFADGHVSFVSEEVSSIIYRNAATYNGGENTGDLN